MKRESSANDSYEDRMRIAGHLDGRKWVERLAVNPDASVSNLRAHYQIVMKSRVASQPR